MQIVIRVDFEQYMFLQETGRRFNHIPGVMEYATSIRQAGLVFIRKNDANLRGWRYGALKAGEMIDLEEMEWLIRAKPWFGLSPNANTILAVEIPEEEIEALFRLGTDHAGEKEEPLAVAVYKSLDWFYNVLELYDQGWRICRFQGERVEKKVEASLGLPLKERKLTLVA